MKATAPGMLQHHWARGQRDVPSLTTLSLEGPTSHKSPAVPRSGGAPPERACQGEQRRMKRCQRSGVVGAAPQCAARPSAPVQPSSGSLITRHRGGMEALAGRRQSPRRYHRNNPYPAQASKGFVRVPVCASPSPPRSRCCFLCVCARKRFFFFSLFPGKCLAPGLGSCEK